MATTTVQIDAPPHAVFTAIATPATYPTWLIGCKDIRAVDAGWPAPGSCFHHRVGVAGPLTVDDTTKVLEIDKDARLVLQVRARPLGRGTVTFVLRSIDGGTELAVDEHPIGALQRLTPLLDPLTAARNRRSLDNLKSLVEDSDAPTSADPANS